MLREAVGSTSGLWVVAGADVRSGSVKRVGDSRCWHPTTSALEIFLSPLLNCAWELTCWRLRMEPTSGYILSLEVVVGRLDEGV